MSQHLGMNLLFYSQNPQDQVSSAILTSLSQNPQLDKLFIKICVEQATRLPRMVIKENVVPVVVVSGFDQIIKGYDALTWIQGSALGNSQEGPMGMDLNTKDHQIYSTIGQEDQNSLQQFYHDQYNHGFQQGDREDQNYQGQIKAPQRIVTYNEQEIPRSNSTELHYNPNAQIQRPAMSYQPLAQPRMGGGMGEGGSKTDIMNQRLQILEQQRQMDLPMPTTRMGGLPSVATRPDRIGQEQQGQQQGQQGQWGQWGQGQGQQHGPRPFPGPLRPQPMTQPRSLNFAPNRPIAPTRPLASHKMV